MVILCTYAEMTEDEARRVAPHVVFVDAANRIAHGPAVPSAIVAAPEAAPAHA